MGAVEGSTLSVAVCSQSSQCLVCVCVILWDTCLAVQLVKPANGKALARFIGLSQTPSGLKVPQAGLLCMGNRNLQAPELLEAVATYNIPSHPSMSFGFIKHNLPLVSLC